MANDDATPPQSVLVPVDGSELSREALVHTLTHHPDADVTVLTVVDFLDEAYGAPPGGTPTNWDEWYDEAEQRAREVLDDAEDVAADHGAEPDAELLLGSPARAIDSYAEEHDVDQIIMGSHGREGVSRVLLGSVAEAVMRRAPCPVTVVR